MSTGIDSSRRQQCKGITLMKSVFPKFNVNAPMPRNVVTPGKQPPIFMSEGKPVEFFAKDYTGQWYYVNHADTWQTCPPPFKSGK